jgi:hypothetical protein
MNKGDYICARIVVVMKARSAVVIAAVNIVGMENISNDVIRLRLNKSQSWKRISTI